MQKNDLEYVVAMLKESNIKAVSDKVGLSYRTVWGIANETNKSPSFNTVRVLAEYFRRKA